MFNFKNKNSNFIRQLTMMGSKSVCSCSDSLFAQVNLDNQISQLLNLRNGFFAFSTALQVYSIGCNGDDIDAIRWNAPEYWKLEYGSELTAHWFFAQDIFGEQFSINDGQIYRFNPESGILKSHSPNLEVWAEKIIKNAPVETGEALAIAWQKSNRPLKLNERLVPKVPFVLGGEYTISNLVAMDTLESLHFRAFLALQIKNMPDGTKVKINLP